MNDISWYVVGLFTHRPWFIDHSPTVFPAVLLAVFPVYRFGCTGVAFCGLRQLLDYVFRVNGTIDFCRQSARAGWINTALVLSAWRRRRLIASNADCLKANTFRQSTLNQRSNDRYRLLSSDNQFYTTECCLSLWQINLTCPMSLHGIY